MTTKMLRIIFSRGQHSKTRCWCWWCRRDPQRLSRCIFPKRTPLCRSGTSSSSSSSSFGRSKSSTWFCGGGEDSRDSREKIENQSILFRVFILLFVSLNSFFPFLWGRNLIQEIDITFVSRFASFIEPSTTAQKRRRRRRRRRSARSAAVLQKNRKKTTSPHHHHHHREESNHLLKNFKHHQKSSSGEDL